MPKERPCTEEQDRAPAALWSRNYLRIGAALAVLYFGLPDSPARLIVWPLIGLSAVAAVLLGVRRNHPTERMTWFMLAGGAACLNLGDYFSNLHSLVLHSAEPFPAYIDALYVAMYPMLIASLAILVRHRSTGRERATVIDAGIITGGLALVWWVLLLAPYIRSTELSLGDRLTAIVYPLGDLVILATTVRLALGGGRRPPAFKLVIVGLFALMTADALFGYLDVSGQYHEHTWIDVGWIIFYVFLGAAALHPSMRDLSTPSMNRRKVGVTRLGVIVSAVLLAPAVLFTQDALGTVSDATPIAITGGLLVLLVLVRIVDLVRDAADLRSEARFRALVDKSSDAIVLIDSDARIQYHTPSTEALLGRSADELARARVTDLLAFSDEQRLRAILSREATSSNLEWRVRHGDGGWRDLEVIAVDLRGTAEVDGIVLTMRDITTRKQLDLELRHQALHDSLTGLPNRSLFADRVDQALKRAEREGSSVAVLFLDIDDFKLVNDSLGHAAGDDVLVAIAARLSAVTRAGDTAARLGGDEFGFIVEVGEIDDGVELAALLIQDTLRDPFVVGDREMQLHASIGIAVGSPGAHTRDDLLRDADLAMYFAKRKGKGRFELFQPEMHEDATHRLQVAAELPGGLDRGELITLYQPIVDIGSGRIVGAEALVRWQHPQLGMLGPNEFIPVAEATGQIGALDRWVLNDACRQAKAWQDRHIADESFYVSVNISPRHLQERNIASDIRDALMTSGLSSDSLVLEVTETALIDDVDTASTILAGFKNLGVRIAVDDFGTGFSSLTHLMKFPLDIVKIDRSFVERVVSGVRGELMVRAVVELAHTLGLKTIAEGVENLDQANKLEDIDCHLAQGYLFSRPVPAEALAELLTEFTTAHAGG